MSILKAVIMSLGFISVANVHAAQESNAVTDPTKAKQVINIQRNGSTTAIPGASKTFTGNVRIDSLFKGTDPSKLSGGVVTFEPAARTAWHTHPSGQLLIITAGKGWIQQSGESVQEMNPGDTVWIPAGVKHWHGATPTQGMTHIAIAELSDGKSVDWLEKVSDEQYHQ